MKGRLLFSHLLTAAFPGRPRHATARVVLWEHGGRNSRLKVQGKREGGKLQTGRRHVRAPPTHSHPTEFGATRWRLHARIPGASSAHRVGKGAHRRPHKGGSQ